MLLVIDVGNTNIVLGIYSQKSLVQDWRIPTYRKNTVGELHLTLNQLFQTSGIQLSQIDQIVIACVVPSVAKHLVSFCEKHVKASVFWINTATQSFMPNLCVPASDLGADRLVNALGAHHLHPNEDLIVIDFGTATTFDVISAKGEYKGGVIAPGIQISSEALSRKAARLPRVELFVIPEKIVGTNTVACMQSGIIYGYAAMVEGMIGRIAQELGVMSRVIATGGFAALLAKTCSVISAVHPTLTLEGLRCVAELVWPKP